MRTYEDGVREERERVRALMTMKSKPGFHVAAIAEELDRAIADGRSIADATSAVVTLLTSGGVLAELDSAGDIDTGAGSTVTGEEPRAVVNDPVTEV